MSRPDDVTGLPVLDRERWDAEADLALGARTVDLAAVRGGAVQQRRGRRVRWAGLAAAAAVVGLLAVALGPWGGRLLSAPVPPAASAPTGLPDRIWTPPVWTPSVTEAPMGRVAAIFTAPVTGGGWTRSAGTGLVLVSDDSQYRTLPGRSGTAVSVSKDGRGVAWTPQGGGSQVGSGVDPHAVLRWVDVRTGKADETDVTVDGRPSEVIRTAWSPDRRWIGVGIQYGKENSTAQLTQVGGALALVDSRTGRVHWLCTGCSNQIGFDAVGRVLLPSGTPGTLPAGLGQGLLPAGGDSASLLPQPTLLADGTSATPVYVVKKDSGALGQTDGWWVVRTDPDGSTHRIPLPGTHVLVDLLALSGGDVLAQVGDETPVREIGDPPVRFTVQRIPVDGPDGVAPTLTEVLRYGGDAPGSLGRSPDYSVVAISADVAATGKQVPATAPTFPWWQPSHVRWWAGGGPDLGFGLPVLVGGIGVVLLGSYRGVQGVRRRIAWRRERLEAGR